MSQGSKYDGVQVEVLNWEQYNPRTDAKKPTWFRLENSIATGPGFFGLDCEQKWLWVFILSWVSQQNGQPLTWNSGYVLHHTGISIKKQDQTIEIFEKFTRLRVSRKVTLRDSHATNERTDETKRDETNELLPLTPAGERPGVTIPTWESYREAYTQRYGTAPVRNATVNSQLSAFVKRIGAGEAPLVAAFFVTHNEAFYVKTMHPVSIMLKDAEKLRTEWATGKRMSSTVAREQERRQANVDVVREVFSK